MVRPTARSRRGASAGGPGLATRLQLYLRSHAQNAVASLGRLSRQPFASLLTILVIGVALALPAVLHLLVVNARHVTGTWDSAVDLTAYFQPGTGAAEIETLRSQFAGRDDVRRVTLVDEGQALKTFRERSGMGEILDALGENPLPAALIVSPRPGLDQPGIEAIALALSEGQAIDTVQFDTAWVKRFHAMLEVVRRAALTAAALLALAVLLIVGNTVRMEIYSRRDEIEVTKLIGAHDSFIRRPFLYAGLWYGLLGGVAAVLLVYGVRALLAAPVARLAGLYGGEFRLLGLGMQELGLLTLGGGLLGLIGAWVTAGRHMRRIEPE